MPGKDLRALALFIKVNITVTLQLLKSLSVVFWKHSTCSCSTGSSREDHHLFSPLCLFLSIGGPANLCDSVATECLPAAECSAAAAPRPLPPFLLCAASLQTPTRLASLLFLLLLPLDLQAKSSSFRTGPPVLNLLLTTATPESVLSKPPLPFSLRLSCQDDFSRRQS